MPKLLSLPLLALLALLPAAALAHEGHAAGSGFAYGFLHPLGGLDHILAMLAVGLFACHLGRRALWLVPVAFVATMALGGSFGAAALGLPLVELGIALSVVVIGGLVALRRAMPTALAMAIVGVFALFHGYAHGAEMVAAVSGLDYALGFIVATAMLHSAGIMAGLVADQLWASRGIALSRTAGAAIAVTGVLILAGTI
jgi:urease accessory protein